MNAPILDRAAFIRENTQLLPSPLVPEIGLHLATEAVALWQMTEEALAEAGLPPPYWAFAWAGGQALARYVLDNPETVAGKRVIDFAAGSGLVAIAAARAGASSVTANDIDPFSHHAMRMNAEANSIAMDIVEDDIVGDPLTAYDVILAADICYEQPLSGQVEAWFRTLAASGRPVLMGDPGRNFRPSERMEKLAHYAVPTTRELEDNDVRSTDVWRILP
ncbi:MAG: class I SAM-dependent methyltransferase [Minwuia sp.]|uniref:class I SAM-dependent methyltransferase n=1 Tax=Minwuia sp. TaxID=2493630 RepID=UPI003A8A31D8